MAQNLVANLLFANPDFRHAVSICHEGRVHPPHSPASASSVAMAVMATMPVTYVTISESTGPQ